MHRACRILLPVILACLGPGVMPGQAGTLETGIYAAFSTSLGGFTCRLEHVKAPRTTANFVALAEGSNAWINLKTGEDVRAPFFTGGVFHRVVAGFVIQGGGQAVGSSFIGPGYSFRDEFHPELLHNTNGVLAMANSGPNTQGSQFYITLATNYSSGDGKYSIFGRVIDGMNVVQAIGQVPVTNNSRPVADVVISNVAIVRVGAEALQFDSSAHALPQVGGTRVGIEHSSGCVVTFPRPANSAYHFFRSSNLVTWARGELRFDTNAAPAATVDVTAISTGAPVQYFNLAQVTYPGPVYTPISVTGMSFHMFFTASTTRFDHVLGGNGTGTWRYVTAGGVTNQGNIALYDWSPSAYAGRLYVEYDSLVPMLYDFAFDVPASNRFQQTVFNGFNPVYYGYFTTSGP
jgi:peptidyl-prolyl cis-trans isomerase A (cyclophilin A)